MDAKFALLVFPLWLIIRLGQWIRRVCILKRAMPVVPVLFPTISKVRLFVPRKWQTYHRDWHTTLGRAFYTSHGSDIVALVSLFEYDQIFISDPAGFVEVKVTKFDRFEKDAVQAKKVPTVNHLRELPLVTTSPRH
jgi:hypothetical protein